MAINSEDLSLRELELASIFMFSTLVNVLAGRGLITRGEVADVLELPSGISGRVDGLTKMVADAIRAGDEPPAA